MIINRKSGLDSRLGKTDLRVLESGFACIDETWRGDDILSIYNRIYYIIEGEGANVSSETESITMQPGHIYLIPAGYRYQYRCKGAVKKVYFHINIKRDDGYDAFSDFGRVGEVNAPELVDKVNELYEKDLPYACFALKGYLLETIAAIAKKYNFDLGNGNVGVHSALLRSAERYIQNNLSVQLTRREIAEYCKVSQGKLANCFKDELGVSVGKYIDDLVFMEAVRRLIYTDDPLRMISDDLGFCDQFYFSRRFNELYNVSPLKYRYQMQNSR